MAKERVENSHEVDRVECPACGRETLARYSSGWAHCFSANCDAPDFKWDSLGEKPKDGANRTHKEAPKKLKKPFKPLTRGVFKGNADRDISPKVAQRSGYYTGIFPEDYYPEGTKAYEKYENWLGEEVEWWNAFDGDTLVAQKVRLKGSKEFLILGDGQALGKTLTFSRSAPAQGKVIVITEGEYDALSYMDCRENWPAVSLPQGAGAARRVLEANLEFLEGYEKVVLQFDNDAPGHKAMEDCKGVLSPGKLHIGALPRTYKDYNEAWKAGDAKAIVHSVFQASKVKMTGLVEVEDIIDRLDEPIQPGLPWFNKDINEFTYGRFPGQFIGLGAATGAGKTDFLFEQILYDTLTLHKPVCTILLETPPEETLEALASKAANRFFEPPREGVELDYDPSERRAFAEKFLGLVKMYDGFGQTDWEDVKLFIRQVAAMGVEIIYLDHLTALAEAGNEKDSLEKITKEGAGLAQELGLIIIYVSHLTTAEGKPHEEGGRVMIKHFKGSRSIGFWSHVMIGLERDQQAEDEEERRITTVRMLKIRKRGAGRNTGKTTQVIYNVDTGRLTPVVSLFDEVAEEM